MSKLVFWVLDVGQGSGNFLQVFDDKDKLVGSVLLDLGSERKKADAGFPSAEIVAGLLSDSGTLDLVVLSHSDSDHINLIPELLSYFTASELTINTVVYGGDYGRYQKRSGTNILDQLDTYMPVNSPDPLPPGFSAFFGNPKPAPNYTLGDLKLWILMANAAEPGQKKAKVALQAAYGTKRKAASDGYNVNTNSVVVLLAFRGFQFVVTGDATGTTLYQINRVVSASVKKAYLNAVAMLTLPHHGSATTTFDVRGGIDGEDNLTTFVDNITPYSLTGSADKVRTFKHPSAKVMEFFWAGIARGKPYWKDPTLGGRHFYTAYFTPDDKYDYADGKGKRFAWPSRPWWYSVQTESNIYTNMYVDQSDSGQQEIVLPPNSSARMVPDKPKPPRALGVAWTYTVTNVVTLTMQVNRPDYERMIAARGIVPTGWPHPDALGENRWVSLPSPDEPDEPDAAQAADARPTAAPPDPALPRHPAPTSRRPLPRLRALP
ncbi:hypothetical protein [Streptomyces sp. NPDC090445]|uniref:hypothetical protein n=1 Tax=Streptomyces sp. NPDC090445 TaxID=3365963 RepID=UPI003828DD44